LKIKKEIIRMRTLHGPCIHLLNIMVKSKNVDYFVLKRSWNIILCKII